jgi:two-component system, chemotaxis family, protein-glutamate methylesterase/glutaminase
MGKKPGFVIVIGASAGGLNALCEVIAQFPKDINASIFVVLHLSRRGIGEFLQHRLQQYTELKCEMASDKREIERSHIYIAPPNLHLLIKEDVMIISDGVHENRWRPSIDVLFRSAAVAYSNRTIGVMLTGLLDDGTAGMIAIKKCGGICIVQDPNEAEYPDMPLSVLNNVQVDYCVPLAQMGFVILDYIHNAQLNGSTVPQDILAESELVEKLITSIDAVSKLGDHSLYACPDCGGGLWEIKENNFRRYRCHIGHLYSEADLLKKQQENIEESLWVALRMLEERKSLLKRISEEEVKKGLAKLSEEHKQRAEDLERHIDTLKKVLFDTKLT